MILSCENDQKLKGENGWAARWRLRQIADTKRKRRGGSTWRLADGKRESFLWRNFLQRHSQQNFRQTILDVRLGCGADVGFACRWSTPIMTKLQRAFGFGRATRNAAHFANMPRRRDELHQRQNRDEQPRANRKFAARQQKRKCAHDVAINEGTRLILTRRSAKSWLWRGLINFNFRITQLTSNQIEVFLCLHYPALLLQLPKRTL